MNIINSLLGVQFGGVTLTLLAVVLLVLSAALVTQLGIWLVRFAIAADDENAPKFEIKNFVWDRSADYFSYLDKVYNNKIEKVGGLYYLYAGCGNYYARDKDKGMWSCDIYKLKYCAHKTRESAEKLGEEIYGKGYDKSNLVRRLKTELVMYVVIGSIATDIILLSLSYYFFPTVVFCSIASFFGLTRYISRKVYANSGKIDLHEERITKLEGDKSK